MGGLLRIQSKLPFLTKDNMPEVNPPNIEIMGIKRFGNLFDCLKYIYTETTIENYAKNHPETVRFIRRKLQPLR
mgnify:CR=1 FL=1